MYVCVYINVYLQTADRCIVGAKLPFVQRLHYLFNIFKGVIIIFHIKLIIYHFINFVMVFFVFPIPSFISIIVLKDDIYAVYKDH